MITKKEVLEAANRGEGCLGKAADNEPVFVLRAQDIHAADLVEKWAAFCRPHIPTIEGKELALKVREAQTIAELMREYPGRRQPD